MKVLSKSDLDMLALLCDSWSNFIRSREVVKEKGMTYEVVTRTGTVFRERPEYKIMQAEKSNLAKFFSEFGMSPSSRGKVEAFETLGISIFENI